MTTPSVNSATASSVRAATPNATPLTTGEKVGVASLFSGAMGTLALAGCVTVISAAWILLPLCVGIMGSACGYYLHQQECIQIVEKFVKHIQDNLKHYVNETIDVVYKALIKNLQAKLHPKDPLLAQLKRKALQPLAELSSKCPSPKIVKMHRIASAALNGYSLAQLEREEEQDAREWNQSSQQAAPALELAPILPQNPQMSAVVPQPNNTPTTPCSQTCESPISQEENDIPSPKAGSTPTSVAIPTEEPPSLNIGPAALPSPSPAIPPAPSPANVNASYSTVTITSDYTPGSPTPETGIAGVWAKFKNLLS